ncbi:MAG: hypothetical protein KBG77_16925 [Dermatophilaceae bacterium]|jgi:hypothetical protein|nr:hypothetical protein [Dermatophilaceae bacterium]
MKRKALITIAAAATLALAGCAETKTVSTAPSSTSATAPAEVPSSDYSPSTTDFQVKLKVTDQQCFGSAGCNVTVEPRISKVEPSVPDEGTIDLTFKVSGDESGPVIETSTLDLADGTYSSSEMWLSTSSSGVTPKAKVTEIEYTN